jgi:exosortase/archaeosortase family protein
MQTSYGPHIPPLTSQPVNPPVAEPFPVAASEASARRHGRLAWPRVVATCLTGASCVAAARVWPDAVHGFFAHGSAVVASWQLGCPVEQSELGWVLPGADFQSEVTAACSGADFFAITATLLAWRFLARPKLSGLGVLAALGLAAPVTLAVNGLRIVAVTQAHRWIIPHFPDAYGPLLHMLTGVAVFLPALLFLHALLRHALSRLDGAGSGPSTSRC